VIRTTKDDIRVEGLAKKRSKSAGKPLNNVPQRPKILGRRLKRRNEGSFLFQKENEDVEVFLTPTDVIESTPQSKP
jgi:hypothetical protein